MVDVVDVGMGVVDVVGGVGTGVVVIIVEGFVKIEEGGTTILTTGGSGDGFLVVFSTGGGKMYFIFGGQQGIFVVVAF